MIYPSRQIHSRSTLPLSPDRRVARRYAADSRTSPDHADAGLGDRRRKAAEFWSHLNGFGGQAD